ncbi:DUF4296 domain-containing protein [Bacteroides stercorirosoris]|uniref:DUF4296 domain-containing protein n=1 Tax=Bacteroides stercorirosoris TaxID=871324 RepID=A0A413H8U5_9BACE|nr:DUF4296 domain-containing protein [Bacteroides stercorirosoris]RGX80061.1 DUF4296 domain-containing protein [Bacteroides stercorirosoris]
MRGLHRIQWLNIFMLAFCFTACQVKRPKVVISDAKMENVLYDYHIAKAMGEEVPYTDSYKRVLYIESVFKKHGITQAVFDSSMVWFTRNPDVLTKIYEKVNTRLKAERSSIDHLISIRDNKPKESLPGDSIDVWAWQRIYQLTGMPMDNKITFVLPSDTNFKDRDTLRWNVRFRFHNGTVDSMYAPVMAMQVVYKNDSIISDIQKVYKSGMETISLHADTLGEIKEIRGSIYYPSTQVTHTLLTDRISLMRYHATDTLSFAKNDSVQIEKKEDGAELKKEEVKPIEQKEEKIDGNLRRRDVGRPRPVSEPTLKKVEKPETLQFRKDKP